MHNDNLVNLVSGDGLLHEVYNGIFEREDWRVTCKIPIGIIPAGSGNGLAYSIAWQNMESFKLNLVTKVKLCFPVTKYVLISQ